VKTCPVVMRFSTTPGDLLPDSVSTPRGLAAHRPLGSINRLRKQACVALVHFRCEHTGRQVKEPTTLEGLFADEQQSELTDVYYP